MGLELTTVVTTLSLYAAVVVSPGPNFALIGRLAASGARDEATGAVVGLALAATFWAVLTMTGLALVLTSVTWLAGFIHIVGGCYLICLGTMAWRPAKAAAVCRAPPGTGGTLLGLRMGLLVNLTNPKGIAFFLGLYAFAIPVGTATWIKLVILAGGFALEVVWYATVAVLLSSSPARLAYERLGPWIERGIGTLLGAVGLRLIVESLW